MNTHWSLEYWPRPDLRRIVKSSPKSHRITIWWRACQTSNWEKIAQSTSIYTFLWCWTRERFIWDDDDYVEHIPKDEKLFWSLLAPLQRPVETFIRLEQGLHGQVYSECVKVICRLVWLSVPLCKKPSDDHSTPGWYGGLPPEITGVHTDFLPPYPFHHNILRPSSLHPETASIIPKVIRLLMWNMLNCSFSMLNAHACGICSCLYSSSSEICSMLVWNMLSILSLPFRPADRVHWSWGKATWTTNLTASISLVMSPKLRNVTHKELSRMMSHLSHVLASYLEFGPKRASWCPVVPSWPGTQARQGSQQLNLAKAFPLALPR